MTNLFFNPFVEGLILIVLGLTCTVLSAILKITELSPTGFTLIGLGVGYVSGNQIGKTNVTNGEVK